MSADAIARGVVITSARATITDTVTALVEREAPGLLAYFVRRTLSPDDAADLLGDTLVVVWRRKSSLPDDETKARMWLYGVARKVLSGHRRGAKRQTALGERLHMQLTTIQATQTDDDGDHVRDQIATLPDVDQEIIRLAYWEGFNLVEIASIMSMRPGTVRSRHSRAMSKLRGGFGDAGVK